MKRLLWMFVALVSLTMLVGCSRGITVQFVENGGTEVADLNIEQGLTIDEVTIERVGYTFAGWFEDEEFTTAFDFNTEIVRNMTLYAKWTINSYSVTFVYNNGSDDYILNGNYNSGLTYPEDPTKEGYVFDKWYLDVELETECELNAIPSENITVYAGWIANEYTVNFYYEQGQDPVYTEQVKYGEGVESIPALPVTTGYTNVWSEDVSVITSDLEVYVASTILEYTITFEDESGTTYETLTLDYGSYIVPTSTPSKVGYDFIGYYSDTLGTNIDLTTYTVSEDLVLQDVFQIQNYSVIFFGGENGAALDQQYINYGSQATAPTEGLDKVGYTFTGWDVAFDNVTGDLNVYAVYTINQYNAVFNANLGEFADTSGMITLTQDYNSNVAVPEVPTRDGFVFDGWYTDLTFATQFNFGPGVPMPVDGINVYAKWIELIGQTYTVSGTYYFEQADIAVDELSLLGTYTQTGSEIYTPFYNIYYDTDMSAVREIEGYEFYKYVVGGVDYFDESELVNIQDDTTVDVYYRKTTLTVTFTDLVEDEEVITTYYVHYNSALVNVPTPTSVVGMTVEWDKQNFTNIQEHMNVIAIYYDNSYETVIFMSNDTIMYITTNEPDPLTMVVDPNATVIATDSPLWDLEIEGYIFEGWYLDGVLIPRTDLLFSDARFTTNIVTLEAGWTELVALEEATNISIDVETSNNTITIDFTVIPSVINTADVYPADFTFILNGNYIQSSDVASDSLMNYITQTGDVFTLTLASTDAYYDLFKELLFSADSNYTNLIVGTHILQIVSVGDGITTTNSDTSDVCQYAVQSVYDGIPEAVTTSDYYLIEDFGDGNLRYVFYSNLTYQFNGKSFEIIQGSNVITANDNVLTTSANTGEFIFTITDTSGTRTYNGLVVEDIRQFDFGSSYQNYLNEMNGDPEDVLFLNNTTSFDYLVGASNDFYLDLLISDNNGSRIDLEDVLLDYEFYLDGSTTALTEAQLLTYVEIDGNVMNFKNLAVGHDFKVTVNPKYEATQMNMDALDFYFHINDGYNAFTNAELKTLYSDMNVHLINIQRNIEAELNASQLHADGTPKNYFAHVNDNPETIGNVYYRIAPNTDDDYLVVEGNFMTIDGSDIPIIKAENDGFGTINYSELFDIISTQIGIFYYNVKDTEPVNNNTFTMNNLRIIGNTTTPSVNYSGSEEEILYEESLMEQNSGGILGVVVRAGDAALNNTIIGYTSIGITTNAYGENSLGEELIVDLDYVQVYGSWGNSIYLWKGSGVSLDNCDIQASGGAAIHFDDVSPGPETYDNPQLIISNTTEINNWVSGSEAWFKAYGMSSVALVLKSSIDTSLADLQKTVIEVRQNPVTGLDTEMMNLVFLSLPKDSAHTTDPNNTSLVLTASEVILDITDNVGTTHLERSFDFIDSDPRTSDGQFAFAVGSLSETNAFLLMVNEIMSTYQALYGVAMDPNDASSLAYIAGFYNLNAVEALTVGGLTGAGMTIHQAIADPSVKGTLDYPQPEFIEVISALPLTDAGDATILIEMFNDVAD